MIYSERGTNVTRPGRSRTVHRLFNVGLLAKAIDGVLEVVGGLLLLLVDPHRLTGWIQVLAQQELSEDPDSAVAGFLSHSVQHLSTGSTGLFAAIFLLGHGLVKLGLVLALLRRYPWAYPMAMLVFGMLVAYQCYRYSQTHSGLLLALSVLDVGVIILTWLEYRRVREVAGNRPPLPRSAA